MTDDIAILERLIREWNSPTNVGLNKAEQEFLCHQPCPDCGGSGSKLSAEQAETLAVSEVLNPVCPTCHGAGGQSPAERVLAMWRQQRDTIRSLRLLAEQDKARAEATDADRDLFKARAEQAEALMLQVWALFCDDPPSPDDSLVAFLKDWLAERDRLKAQVEKLAGLVPAAWIEGVNYCFYTEPAQVTESAWPQSQAAADLKRIVGGGE